MKTDFIDKIKTSFHYIFSYLENVSGFNYYDTIRHFDILIDLLNFYKLDNNLIKLKNKLNKEVNTQENVNIYLELLEIYNKINAIYNKNFYNEFKKELIL